MPLERIVFRNGDEITELRVTTDKIRPCRFGLIVQDGGYWSVAFRDLIKREHVYLGRAKVTYPYGVQGENDQETTRPILAA